MRLFFLHLGVGLLLLDLAGLGVCARLAGLARLAALAGLARLSTALDAAEERAPCSRTQSRRIGNDIRLQRQHGWRVA